MIAPHNINELDTTKNWPPGFILAVIYPQNIALKFRGNLQQLAISKKKSRTQKAASISSEGDTMFTEIISMLLLLY